jgi:LexA-binding, inner membrane-associated putative hydrolase
MAVSEVSDKGFCLGLPQRMIRGEMRWMFDGFHALLPVIGCLAIEAVALTWRGERVFPDWMLPVVALFGVLPDLCSPHISLEDRYASGSHSLLFLGFLLPVCAGLVRWFPKGMRLRVAVATWMAAVLHLAADAVSGGIPWLLPWSAEPLGDYRIQPDHWLFFDAGLIVLALGGWWLRNRLEVLAYERSRRHEKAGLP